MKLVLKLVAAVVVLIIIAVGVLVFYIDHLAKTGIEKGSTYALDVPTTVDDVSVGILRGEFEMTGLNVANPAGFNTPHFLNLGKGHTAVTLGSLMEETVEIKHIRLSDIDVNLEKNGGKANYQAILDALKKFESQSEDPPPDEAGSSKKFVVRLIEIENVQVHADVLPIGGELTRLHVVVPKITLQDIGTESDQGVVIAELTQIMVQAILKAIVDKAGGLLPTDLLGDLDSALAQLKSLDQLGVKLTSETFKSVEALTEAGQKVVGETAKQVGEATKKIGDAVKDLPGGTGDGVKNVTDQIDKSVKDAAKGADDLLKGVGGLLDPKKKKEPPKE